MLSALAGSVITSLATTFIGKVADAFAAYQNKVISLAELNARVQQALLETFAEVERSHADALAKTYAAFMGAVVQSRILQVMWAATVGSQLLVLIWHQVGIPFIVFMKWTDRYPSSGTTVEWAYLLLAACLGMGPVILRSGPGAGTIKDSLKSLIGK